MLERLLVEHAERGEEPDLGQFLDVHGGQTGVVVAVLGADGLGLAHELVHGPAVGVAAEVVDERPRRRDRVEGRVGHRPADSSAQRVVAPAVDLDPLDHPRPQLRVEVAGEGIERFVIVVVRVEDGRVDSVHGQPSASVRNTADSIGWGSAAPPTCGWPRPGRPPRRVPPPSGPRRPARAVADGARPVSTLGPAEGDGGHDDHLVGNVEQGAQLGVGGELPAGHDTAEPQGAGGQQQVLAGRVDGCTVGGGVQRRDSACSRPARARAPIRRCRRSAAWSGPSAPWATRPGPRIRCRTVGLPLGGPEPARAFADQPLGLLRHRPLGEDDEAEGLAIRPAGRPRRREEDVAQRVVGHRFVGVAPDGPRGEQPLVERDLLAVPAVRSPCHGGDPTQWLPRPDHRVVRGRRVEGPRRRGVSATGGGPSGRG